MGQQQLLLLVLGIVIVGIAVVAGIQAFSEGRDKAQQDAAVSDAMRIISDVQAWKLKPTAFGGGDNGLPTDFGGITYQALGIRAEALNTAGQYPTVNGCYDLSGDTAAATLVVYRTDCAAEIATVTVDGTGTTDIEWVYATAAACDGL
jgi:type II secretory pathway pseudopilin PulG